MTLAKQGTADWLAVPLVEYSPTVALVLYLQIKTLMTIVKQNLKIKEIIDNYIRKLDNFSWQPYHM